MKDRNGNLLIPGQRVFISLATQKKYKLPQSGIVKSSKINNEQLVTVSTVKGDVDLHAKSIWVEYFA